MLGTKKCPFCAEKIQRKAKICKHCKSDLQPQMPVNQEVKKIEGPTFSEKMEQKADEEKAYLESLSPEEKETYLKEKNRKWKVNIFWVTFVIIALCLYGLSEESPWMSWLAFLVLFVAIWLYPGVGEERFFKNRLAHLKDYKGRLTSSLIFLAVTLFIFVPLMSEALEEKARLEHEAFIENYPEPGVVVLSEEGNQGDATEYELRVVTANATSVLANSEKMIENPEHENYYSLIIPLDSLEEAINIVVKNEYKENILKTVVSRNETPEEKEVRLVAEAAAEEKRKEKERLAQEAQLEKERLAKEVEEARIAAEKEARDRIIKEGCKAEWSTDFQMQAYCERQQYEALATLNQGKPGDISDSEFNIIRSSCKKDWPDDFQMQAYCEKQQYEAVRELR